MSDYMLPLAGGVLIGIAILLMLIWTGRVTGVSGILNGALKAVTGDIDWRVSFLIGLIVGGFFLRSALPGAFTDASQRGIVSTIFAGLLVGFGTVMGGGCTSGHGICGVSRASPRSILATVVFMLFGIISATVYRLLLGSGA